MNTEITDRFKNEFLVLLHNGYEYGDWFWFPEMSPAKLEEWWKSQKDFKNYFYDTSNLPGHVLKANTLKEENLYLELRFSNYYYKADINSPLSGELQAPFSSESGRHTHYAA